MYIYIYYLCKADIGNEIHALLQCKNPVNELIRTKFIKQISNISIPFSALPDAAKLQYIMNASDPLTTPILGKWLYELSQLYYIS